ncbi:MAG: carboxypeptidase-like regulatory domain-containing protein, partial [Gemmatimonadetes bacterium]|nr:carboxypeptidase-like regulatory domain-containing protein [Gemmatimonadota bacterium]
MKPSSVRLAFIATVFSLILGVPQDVNAQGRAVAGTVTDARTGEPISGAQISVRDRGIGALSNAEGRYVLPNLPAGRLEIRVLYLGYSPQSQTVEVPEGETTVINFAMTVQAIQMEELVATGYATQTRREVSSAIGTVTSVNLE